MATAEAMAGQKRQAFIRWMITRDCPEVLEIEKRSFEYPWTEKDFLHCLRRLNVIGMVTELEGRTVGFFVYELLGDRIRLLNLAIHPDFRGQGIGSLVVEKLTEKLRQQRRTNIVALVPESCSNARSFFEKHGIEVRLTEQKGIVTHRITLSAMTVQDADEVQKVEDSVLNHHGGTPRNIRGILSKNSRYGIVACDELDEGRMLGYVLYERSHKGIALDGQFGVIVRRRCRGHGVGRRLVSALVSQQLPITVYDIDLDCRDQCGFLKAVGVPIPEPQRSATVEWTPSQIVS